LRRYLVFLLFVLFSLSTAAAQDSASTWTMTSVEPMGAITGEDSGDPSFAFLAPDGSALAWGEPNTGINVYSFVDQATTNYPFPDEYRGFGRYSSPAWSPDGNYFAFTESLFDFLYESDIWLLDRAAGTITNRTDDGVYGGWLNVEQPFAIDYLPTWNPVNGDLYFFRTLQPEDSTNTTEVFLMPIGRDEPKRIVDLTPDLRLVYSVYRPVAISPDGDTLAFIVLGQQLDEPVNGIWTLDLRTATAQQVVTLDELCTGLPTWQTEDESALFPETVMWAGNDALVVLSRDVQFATNISQMAYYVDLVSGETTPITAFTDVPDVETLFVESDESPLYRMPRSGVVTPDGSTFLFLRHGVGMEHAGISAVSLPPNGSPPVEIGEIEDFNIFRAAQSAPAMSSDGKALIYGYVFQFEGGVESVLSM
jgi:dipeptidyl aminopeptidase/acylaminoacyl peptidase